MRQLPIAAAVLLFTALVPGVAHASWYDDYDAGLNAARAGNWAVVAQRMTSAINAKAKEGNKERAYGTIFYNYHPHYYRGVAYLNLGKYREAISDLETTTGIGPENLGSIEMLLQMAKTKAESSSPPPADTRPPVTTTQPPVQPPVQPVVPRIDAGLRSRAQAAVVEARQKIDAAKQRKATGSSQYTGALQNFTQANSRLAAAKSNDDLNEVIAMADNASMLADAAAAAVVTITPPVQPPATRPAAATAAILADPSRRVRLALESYFRGDFDEAAKSFEKLTSELPNNGWIWAFLGASQYSQYAFEAEPQYRDAAIAAFKKAKRLGRFKTGLPSKYFSRRIRKAYEDTAG